MGRVYAIEPDEAKGERRPPAGTKVEPIDPDHRPLDRVVRVEFDRDADEGDAVVTVLVADLSGRLQLTPDRTAVRRETLKVACRMVFPGASGAPVIVEPAKPEQAAP